MKRKREDRQVEVQYITRALKPVQIKRYRIKCPMCPEWFFSKRSDAIYCSGRCRSRAFRERDKDRRHFAKMQEVEPLFDSPLQRQFFETTDDHGRAYLVTADQL